MAMKWVYFVNCHANLDFINPPFLCNVIFTARFVLAASFRLSCMHYCPRYLHLKIGTVIARTNMV